MMADRSPWYAPALSERIISAVTGLSPTPIQAFLIHQQTHPAIEHAAAAERRSAAEIIRAALLDWRHSGTRRGPSGRLREIVQNGDTAAAKAEARQIGVGTARRCKRLSWCRRRAVAVVPTAPVTTLRSALLLHTPNLGSAYKRRLHGRLTWPEHATAAVVLSLSEHRAGALEA